MDKYESYAVNHYLTEWPESLKFSGIIKALIENDNNYDITVNEVYELYEGEFIAHFMVNMAESLRGVFNEQQ